jgi:hypothetical protein
MFCDPLRSDREALCARKVMETCYELANLLVEVKSKKLVNRYSSY